MRKEMRYCDDKDLQDKRDSDIMKPELDFFCHDNTGLKVCIPKRKRLLVDISIPQDLSSSREEARAGADRASENT